MADFEARLERVLTSVGEVRERLGRLEGLLTNGRPGQARVCDEHRRDIDSLRDQLEAIRSATWRYVGIMTGAWLVIQIAISTLPRWLRW